MKKMKSGDTFTYRSGNVLLMGWKDKRVVLMISTYHDTSMEKTVTIQKGGRQKEIEKPMCVLDYSKHMGGVDRSDHYCATCFHSEISEVVETTLFLVPGSVHCKFIHFVQQP
jgi:hypothetical protein